MKAKLKPHKLLSMLLALVMVAGLLPMGQVAYAEDTTLIDEVYLTYDASKVNLNTAYTEGEVKSQVRNNISSATNGVSVDKLNSGLCYLDDYKVICGVGDGTGQITEGRTYIVEYSLEVAKGSGYDWADKSSTTAIKFYLNGTETKPLQTYYNSSWNSYGVYFELGTPSTDPIVNRVSIDQSDVSVQVGTSFSFTATVAGNVADKTVTWSVSGAASSDTKISDEGVLSVGSDETATTVTVTATSKADSSKSASRTVTITAAPLTIDSVTVSPSSKELYTGDTCSFTVTVTGTENDKSVTWSVTGQTSASTAITSDGTLTVGKDEAAENITVKAVSNADPAKFGEASITIKQIVIIDKVSLTYDASKVNLNTAYTEDEVSSKLRSNISSATTGVSVDKLNSGLRYLDGTTIRYAGYGTGQITEGRTYIVEYWLEVASGYEWADKSSTTAIKFYLNGTETTPYHIDYHSSWNAYRVYYTLGTPSTEPHTHTYDQEIATAEYKASNATCTAKATYYKSCICGAKGTETFEYGEPVHTGTLGDWQYDADNHWKVYSCCGAEAEKTAHVYDNDTDATCNTCGYERTITPITTYDLWVGGTQVTEDNKGDILGDGKANYDPATKTLTLTGATLTKVYNDALIYVKDMELIINAYSGLTLDNTANVGPAIYAYGSHDLTVNGNVDLKADAAPAIACGKNLMINGNAKVSSARSVVLTAPSGSVTINGNATINSGSSAPGISAGANIVLNGSTHEVNSSLLGGAAVTITGDFKSTVTDTPAINGEEVSITGKVDITSGNSLGIAASNKVSIKGDTKIEAKQMAISVNAGSVVLEGTKHELKSTETPGISCSGDITIKGAVIATAGPQAINSTGGTVTIDGDVTATSTTAPAITAKTIEVKSGTWTLSGNPLAMYAKSIVIPDTHEIVKPEGAKLNDEKTGIVEADGTTNVSNATIAPKAGSPKTLDRIDITTPPAKTAYTAGESFDPAGMEVIATYSDSSTATVTGYTVSPAGALSESDTQITVTYTEDGVVKTATQAITVTAASGSGGTGSSGSGGGGVSNYAITVKDAKNGDVTSSHKTASKGTTVTLTIAPDKGYTLETLTVTDKNGDEIELTNKGDGKYTFKMPASKVYVEATFMEDNSMLNFFVDVFPGDYYYDAVLWAAENGITGGVDDTHFAPNATCTRAQAVTFLWRAAGSPAPKSSEMPFEDVAAGSYYYDAVLWAVENGITDGTSATTFSPDAVCSRGQIVTFLWRSQKSPASDSVNPFADVAADAYYNSAVLWAVTNGITDGTSATTFSPAANCTRAQIVTFLYRCLG